MKTHGQTVFRSRCVMRLLVCSAFFIILLIPALCFPASADQYITLTIPQPVLSNTIKNILPIKINQDSSVVQGDIFIESIENLQFKENNVSGLVGLNGKDIKLTTEIAGHRLNLKLGDAKLNFNTSAEVTFDKGTQQLLITPVMSATGKEDDGQVQELGNLLLSLFNGKEFPIEINRFEPAITDTGSRTLAVGMEIVDVVLSSNTLTLHVVPTVKPVRKSEKN